MALKNHERELQKTFGFVVDVSKFPWDNASKVLGSRPYAEYMNRPSKMAFHNLCIRLTPPLSIGRLLGLGTKFVIQRRTPSKKILEQGFDRFARDVCLKYEFAGVVPEMEYIPKIYIKSNYVPDPLNLKLETMIQKFASKITEARNTVLHYSKPRTNLSIQQIHLLNKLRNHPDFMVLICDKNLGPVIMVRDFYIERILKEHLCDKTVYRQLTEMEAT